MRTFNQLFARALNIKVDLKKDKEIPLDELAGTGVNGHFGLAHKKCGCPGLRTMLPTLNGLFKCSGCNGYSSRKSSKIKLKEGEEGYNHFFTQLQSATIIPRNRVKIQKLK